MRKLATVQTIKDLTPIPNADRIVVASMEDNGWKVIVGRDEFVPGEKVVYFETDSFLPDEVETYAPFQARGQKTIVVDGKDVRGHVLRTMKMRGVFSQGLIIGLEAFGIDKNLPNGFDVTEATGVRLYEEPIPLGGDIIGHFDNRLAPKTDAERVQNLADHWEEMKELAWDATVKVDGTSQTLTFQNGGFRIFGRNWELDPDNAVGLKVMPEEVLEELRKNPGVTIQFELAGPGINGNRLRLSKATPFIFSLWKNRVKVPRSEWPAAMLQNSVPPLGEDFKMEGTLEEMLGKVASLRGRVSKGLLDEGVVYHFSGDNAPEWLDSTRVVKIISNAYLAKHGI